jgi:alpha-ribazole phosphatase
VKLPIPTIDLLRHGDTGFTGFRGSLDDALTPLGWQQMEQAVLKKDWDVLISSPLLRCSAFAQKLTSRLNIELYFDERLVELHFGEWEGKTAAELMQSDADALQSFWQDPAMFPPPNGETMQAFSARVLQAWQEIQQQYAGQHTLVVTHGGVIRLILCHTRGLPLNSSLSLEVPHGSLHVIDPNNEEQDRQ